LLTRRVRTALGAALIVVAGACSPAPEPVAIAGEHDGLAVNGQVTSTGSAIAVDVFVRNDREEPVHLVPDQCGRVVDVELERTAFLPAGKQWDGSVQAVKDLVLRDQEFLDRPDSFAPRRVGDSSSAVPDCVRPELLVTLAPGDEIAERWELPFQSAYALRALGSDDTMVTLEALEARDPTELEFLDILPASSEASNREGRVVRAELPLADVLQREATDPDEGPSYGELFDRLIADDDLCAWIENQPADMWREANLTPSIDGSPLRLHLLNTAYERAAVVTATPDGSSPVLDLPGEKDRARTFPRTPGTLPPGIAALPDSDYEVTEDLHVGEVLLPSGRVIVGEYLFELEPLDLTVKSGAYPAHATLARYRDQDFVSVAFASLVFSDAPTVSWEEGDFIAVDGGSTTITSVEGRDETARLFEDDENAWMDLNQRIFDSSVAHDYLATEFTLTPEANLAYFSSGVGDGGYPVYIGFDAEGSPTRVVVDFYLLHLAWPGTSVPE
jgi:Protein of unknown function (DUF4241)